MPAARIQTTQRAWPGQWYGEVAERSNAADCKSVALAASEVRILPSPPAFAHQSASRAGGLRSGRLTTWRPWSVGQAGLSSSEWSEVAGPGGASAGGSNSVVESQPSKLLVAGSIPVSRSSLRSATWSRELQLGKPR